MSLLLQVLSSVIGRNCRIGQEVQIHGCYIHDNVTIADGTLLESAMICDEAVIMAQAVLPAGCVISYQVHLHGCLQTHWHFSHA